MNVSAGFGSAKVIQCRTFRPNFGTPWRIMSAAFSAIIISGAWVLPEVIVGMIEPSRETIDPVHPQRVARPRRRLPMRAVPTGWKIVVAMSPTAARSSASRVMAGPGRSPGAHGAKSGAAVSARAWRTALTATCRSRSVLGSWAG